MNSLYPGDERGDRKSTRPALFLGRRAIYPEYSPDR
jgi:hypothetical protein